MAFAATDRHRITGEVGRGGIGRVLRALDQVLDRPVALKELFSANDGTRRRFIREALITARLQHPSIVPVYDAGPGLAVTALGFVARSRIRAAERKSSGLDLERSALRPLAQRYLETELA